MIKISYRKISERPVGDLLCLLVSSDSLSKKLRDLAKKYGSHIQPAFTSFKAGKNEIVYVFHPDGRSKVALVGLGRNGGLTAESVRKLGAEIALFAKKHSASNLSIALPSSKLSEGECAEYLQEGIELRSYDFVEHKSKQKSAKKSASEIKRICFIGENKTAILQGAKTGQILADSTNFARDLVNWSPGIQSAKFLANQGKKELTPLGVKVQVLGKKEIERRKFGGLLAVNRGSIDPPAFSILEWKPRSPLNKKPIVFVGKGIVFDTGGLSLKPTLNSMDQMKTDMAGAAAVYGAMKAAAQLKLPFHLVGLIPSTDNRPGLNAYVPGEVITMHSGSTVEVLNTDAEGRMVLADALSWAKSLKPELVVDLATLTGAQVVALGKVAAAIMTNRRDGWKSRERQFILAGEDSGDRVAPLPMYDEYADLLKSDVADLKNVGGRAAGCITAAKFLEHFVDYPWVHLDIAGPARLARNSGYRTKGGSGFGVRLLVQYLRNRINEN